MGQRGGWTERWPPLPGPGETHGSRQQRFGGRGAPGEGCAVKPLTPPPAPMRDGRVIPGPSVQSPVDPSQRASSVPVQRWSLGPPPRSWGSASPQGTQLQLGTHEPVGHLLPPVPWGRRPGSLKAGRGGSPGYWLGRRVTPACWGVASVPGVGLYPPHQSQGNGPTRSNKSSLSWGEGDKMGQVTRR